METDSSTLLEDDTVNLCERYKRCNMETLIITVDPKMSSLTHWGSYLGELFLQKKKAIPHNFLEFCIRKVNTSELTRKGKKNKNSVLAKPVQELQDVNKRPKRRRKVPSWRQDYVATEGSSSKKHKSDNDVHDDISRGSCVPNTPAESQGDHRSGVRAGKSAKDTNNVHDEGIVKVEQEETNENYFMQGSTTSNSSVSKSLNSNVPKMMAKPQNDSSEKRVGVDLLSDSKELSTSSDGIENIASDQIEHSWKEMGGLFSSDSKEDLVMSDEKGVEKVYKNELSVSASEAILDTGTQVVDDWSQDIIGNKKDECEKLCHVKVEGQTSDSKGQTQETMGTASRSNRHQNLNGQSQKSNLKLNLCKKGFRTNFRLNVHKKSACDEKRFTCQLCSVNFKYKCSLVKHLLLKHRSKVCPRCKLVLDDEKKMKEHCLVCTAEAKRVTYKCSLCYKGFATADDLNCHMDKHQDTEFECSKCKEVFLSWSSFTVHLKTHTNNQSHLCNSCGKIFSKREYLRRHLRTIHDIYLGKRILTEYKIKCNICSKDFSSKSDLVKHIDATHMMDILQKIKPNSRFTLTSNNESLKCPVCAIQSPNEDEYTLHLARHASETGETFTCEYCGKFFTKKNYSRLT